MAYPSSLYHILQQHRHIDTLHHTLGKSHSEQNHLHQLSRVVASGGVILEMYQQLEKSQDIVDTIQQKKNSEKLEDKFNCCIGDVVLLLQKRKQMDEPHN